MEIATGLVGELEVVVSEQDTAAKWGSGLVPVYSTPALVGLMEGASVQALQGRIEAGKTSVGGRIDVRHLAATPVGMRVHAKAELVKVEDRKLIFKIQAWDEVEQIGDAVHERFVVDEAMRVAGAFDPDGLDNGFDVHVLGMFQGKAVDVASHLSAQRTGQVSRRSELHPMHAEPSIIFIVAQDHPHITVFLGNEKLVDIDERDPF